jgi:4-hydroxy-tetrahydrodipicolinate synthase
MNSKLIKGVYAAVLTPRATDGSFDRNAFRTLIRFLLDSGIQGFAVNGATGEFPLTRPEELRAQLDEVCTLSAGRAKVLCGVGAASILHSLELAEIASASSVTGLLLPAPYYFRYSQADLAAWASEISRQASLPCLLYNLPQFATGFDPTTTRDLIRDNPSIIGVKDSSGSLDTLRLLSTEQPEACRIVGNDSALAAALAENVCDGVVSGVAGVLPELVLELFHTPPETQAFENRSALLSEFIQRIDSFPAPWGLKWAAQARGLLLPHFAQSLARDRLLAAGELQAWLTDWLPKHSLATSFNSIHMKPRQKYVC